MFWVISVYFNIRNTLPKSGTFLLGHPVYSCIFQSSTHIEEKQFYLMGTNEYDSFPPFDLKMDTEPSQKCHVLKMFYFNRQWIQS